MADTDKPAAGFGVVAPTIEAFFVWQIVASILQTAWSAIDISTLHVHNVTNGGQSDLMTLEWTPELFDASKADSYSEEI